MNAVKRGLDSVLKVATAVLFTVMVASAVWQVFAREILADSPAWTSALAGFAFVWTSLIAAALVFGERGHFAVSVVVERFPRLGRKIVAVVVQLLILAFAVLVFIVGGIYAAQNTWTQVLNALPGTVGIMYLALPISGVFISFYAIHHLVEDLRGEGPLTAEVAATEDDIPDTAGLDGQRGPDSDGGSADSDDPKEK